MWRAVLLNRAKRSDGDEHRGETCVTEVGKIKPTYRPANFGVKLARPGFGPPAEASAEPHTYGPPQLHRSDISCYTHR